MTADSIGAVIRRSYRAYAEMDLVAIDALISPQVVFHVPGRHPLAGTYQA